MHIGMSAFWVYKKFLCLCLMDDPSRRQQFSCLMFIFTTFTPHYKTWWSYSLLTHQLMFIFNDFYNLSPSLHQKRLGVLNFYFYFLCFLLHKRWPSINRGSRSILRPVVLPVSPVIKFESIAFKGTSCFWTWDNVGFS